MGSSWSSIAGGATTVAPPLMQRDAGVPAGNKRQRQFSVEDPQVQLIPGLPDEVALQVLARVTRGWHHAMRMVCTSWNRVMQDAEIYNLRRELKTTEQWLYLLLKDKDEQLVWFALDPLSGHWRRLPTMRSGDGDGNSTTDGKTSGNGNTARRWMNVLSGHMFADALRGLFGRRGSSEKVPFFGCSSAEVDGNLVVLGGFSSAAAVACVWKYDPVTNSWSRGASMGTPRAYCKTGVIGRSLYAVGGVNKGRNGLTPLQTAEVYDVESDVWTALPSMPFVGAQVLPTAFVTDILKPIATGLAAFKGQLWVPQSLYSWPFFMDVGGEVYDPARNSWSEMPRGMGEGWPARQAGMKLSVVVDGRLYSLDPASSAAEGSKLKVYDSETDCWKVVVKRVPVLLDLASADSEAPYLLCGLRAGLHIVTKDSGNRVAVHVLGGPKNKSSASASESESDDWSVVSAKHFGRAELVACQVLDL